MKHTKYNYKDTERNRFPIFRRLASIAALLLSITSYSQTTQHIVSQEWMTSSGTQNNFQKSTVRTVTVGGSIYTYVAGSTLNSNGNYDILVQRFSPIGTLMWTQQYNGVGNGDDIAADIRVTPSNGEVYVCGTYYKDATDSNNAIVIKYDQYGNQRWTATYNGSGSRHDGYASMLVNGNSVIAVGATWSTSHQYDMLTRRIDTAGATVWTATYDNAGLNDLAVSLSSKNGSLFVAGGVQNTTTSYKIATWKINPANGSITQTTLSSSSSLGIDRVTDVQEDSSGDVYVAGTVYNLSTGFDIKIFKFSNTLAPIWNATWDGTSLEDGASGVYIDASNNVIVTGYTTTTANSKDFITVKYNSSGAQQWEVQYDDTAHGCDSATAIVTKGTDIYVTGKSFNGQNYNYHTIKYDASGNQIFGIDWNSTPNKDDIPMGIAIDTIGGIVVSGQTHLTGTTYNYFTVKYSERDVILIPDTISMGSVNSQFVENRGQVRDQNMNSDLKVRYYSWTTSPQICMLENTTTSFVLSKIDADSTTQDTITRVDLTFAGSNKVSPKAYDVSDVMSSYYMSYMTESAIRIHQYNHIIYPEIYTNIDLDYASVEGGAKFYYVIKPSGDPTDIKGVFTGASNVIINGNDVLVTTPGNGFTLSQPSAFQIDGLGNFVPLGWQPTYAINGNGEIEFINLGLYDTTRTLVFAIQQGPYGPAVVASIGNVLASTFAGGSLDEVFFDVEQGGGYKVGVGSTRSMPYNLSFQGSVFSNYYGSGDGYMASYAGGSATLLAYTFIGGNGEDEFTAVINDYSSTSPLPYFYFAGKTSSTGMQTQGNSTNGNYYQNSKQGFQDGFIGNISVDFDFSPWRTYFGGSGNESINSLSWANNNLYFTGIGDNLSPLKTESGAYNNNTNGTILIGKFDLDDSLVWSTLYGNGSGKSIFCTGNKLVVAGEANGYSLPIRASIGAYVKTVSDGNDAFIARFNPATDTIIWSTYFGGTGSDDARRTVVDINGNIYLTGTTASFDSIFYNTSPVAYVDSTLSGGTDAYFAKFDSTGVRIWSTFFGGEYDEDGADVDIDFWNDVYFFGFTESDSMYTLHANTLYNQPQIGGHPSFPSTWGDGFIVMLKPNLQPVWSTYFGGNLVDGIHAGCINRSVITMAIAGYAGSHDSASFPIAGPGAQWLNAGWGNNDAFYSFLSINQIYTVSVEENTSNNIDVFSVYPNPSSGQIIVNVGEQKPLTLTVTNALGQIVFSQNKPEIDNNGRIYLDLHTFDQGIYFVNLSYGNNSQTQKFSLIR